jgi:hypothetical protein
VSAVAESIGPQLERFRDQLVLAGDVQLSKTMAKLVDAWRRARVEQAKREQATAQEAAEAKALASKGATLVVELPIHTVSEKNDHVGWQKKHRARGDMRTAVALSMRAYANVQALKIKPPCRVRIVRLAPRELDAGDNLEVSLFRVRDGVADWLGINDRSPEVKWECSQERSKRYGVRIEVWV